MVAGSSATEHVTVVADVMRNALHIVAGLDLIGGLRDAPRGRPTQAEILEAIATCPELSTSTRSAIRVSLDAQSEIEKAQASMSSEDRDDLDALLAIIGGSTSVASVMRNLAIAERILSGRPAAEAATAVRDLIDAGRGLIYDDDVTLVSPREAGATGGVRDIVYASRSPVLADGEAYAAVLLATGNAAIAAEAAIAASGAAVIEAVIDWVLAE
jgi:hypothetical protein